MKIIKNLLKVLAFLATIALIITMFILSISNSLESSFHIEDWTETEYIIQPGDTLWEIADKYCPEGVDTREWIDAVQERNGIDSTLYAGQTLIVFEYNK